MDLVRNGERLIRDWYRNSGKKALLVKGARQVGMEFFRRQVPAGNVIVPFLRLPALRFKFRMNGPGTFQSGPFPPARPP